MRVITRFACLSAIILSLGGCIESEKPLISASEAAMPIAEGKYTGGEKSSKMEDAVVVNRRQDDYVVVQTTPAKPATEYSEAKPEKTTVYTVRFKKLDDDHYIAQIREVKKTATQYQYLFVHVEPAGPVKFYAALCGRFEKSPRVLRAYDFELLKSAWNKCIAKTAAGMVAFMQEIALRFSDFTELHYQLEKSS